MDAITLIELLKDEFVDIKGLPKRKVDPDRCLQLIEELKNSLPTCIKDARKIIENKQQILQNADFVAKNTISSAEEKARRMVAGSEIEQLAQREAQKIINKAAIQRDVLIDKTKTHLDSMFSETEQFLLSLLDMIRKNRHELRTITFN